MGYDIHVTRREHWSDEGDPQISLQEWLEYVATDSEITADPQNPEPENSLVHLRGEEWPLWWYEGELCTKNPDESVILKLAQVARRLDARVLDDDDEIYSIDDRDQLSVERGDA